MAYSCTTNGCPATALAAIDVIGTGVPDATPIPS